MTEPLFEQTCKLCGARSRLIADPNLAIPYALLGCAPQFFFPDLTRTFVRHADEAAAAARAAGLLTVRVGNRHLLSHDY